MWSARRAPTLVALLAPGTATVCVLALAHTLGGATAARTLDADLSVRVVGLALTAAGWFILRGARGVSVGTRRLVARAAASGLLFAGVAHLAGPAVRDTMDAALPLAAPPGARTLVCAMLLVAATVYAWRSSPLRR